MNKKTLVNIFLNPLFLIVLTGLGFRLIAWYNTGIVNLDAAVYIVQAKAIYNNDYSAILTRLNYLSVYSLCIAFLFPLFSDWVLTATLISIFFGTLTIIPCYFFLKEYINRQYALMTTLIIATLPVFVSRSVDIIKDPMYWFFLTSGLYFFVHQLEYKRYKWSIVPFFFFFLATLARVEAFLFLLMSFIFIIICNDKRKYLIGLVILFSAIGVLAFRNIEFLGLVFNKFFRFDYIIALVSGSYHNYQTLRAQLKHLAIQQPLTMQLFLLDAGRDMWLIGIEKIFNSFLEGVAYIPGFFCIIGIASVHMFKMDKKFIYCLILMASSIGLLYVFNLNTWVLSYRYVIIFIIPASVFMGLGLKKVSLYVANKWAVSEIMVMRILVALVLIVAFSKDLKQRRVNQIIYKEAGQFIALHKEKSQWGIIGSSLGYDGLRWISFYANLNYSGYHENQGNALASLDGLSFRKLTLILDKNHVNYYFMFIPPLDDKRKMNGKIKALVESHPILMKWVRPDGGKYYLLQWSSRFQTVDHR